MKLPSSSERVSRNTVADVNARIAEMLRDNIEYYSRRSRFEIERRLDELDQEWDIERVLQVNAAAVSLTGFVAAGLLGRRALVVPVAVAGFLLQHALQGWCPPMPFLRRMGFRTSREIQEERYAMKALRGDFEGIEEAVDPEWKVEEVFRRVSH